jgi:hippurate hydrolase
VLGNTVVSGTVTTRAGAMMAASSSLTVTVRGRGGHGSAPHLSADPVPAACEMVLGLQTAMTRRLDPLTPAVLTVGVLRAGSARNVIPDEAVFEATVRTFDAATSAVIAQAAREVCTGIAAAHGVEVDVGYADDYPVTVNDAAAAARVLAVAGDLLGGHRAVAMGAPITGSEDFSRVLAAVPGAMAFVGAALPGRDPTQAPSNHSPHAAYDEAVLPDGAALYAALALDALVAR